MRGDTEAQGQVVNNGGRRMFTQVIHRVQLSRLLVGKTLPTLYTKHGQNLSFPDLKRFNLHNSREIIVDVRNKYEK